MFQAGSHQPIAPITLSSKEIKYFKIDQETAKEITQVFKKRVYESNSNESPAQLLVDIAVNEFGLAQIDIPEPYRDAVVQRLDSRPNADQPEVQNGAHIR